MPGGRGCREVAQTPGFGERLEFLERLVLDLPDPLARQVKRAPDLVQRARVLAAEAVAELEHPTLAIRKVLQGISQRFQPRYLFVLESDLSRVQLMLLSAPRLSNIFP